VKHDFSFDEVNILGEVASEVEEFHDHMRKGISMNKYAFLVAARATYYDELTDTADAAVPMGLVGRWVMYEAEDLMYANFQTCLRDSEWVRCTKEPVTTYEYFPLATSSKQETT
jgi:hypothetical protein